MNSKRLAALRYRELSARDRRWLLKQLTEDEQAVLMREYRELEQKSISNRISFSEVLSSFPETASHEDVSGQPIVGPVSLEDGQLAVLCNELPDSLLALLLGQELLPSLSVSTALGKQRWRVVEQSMSFNRPVLPEKVRASLRSQLSAFAESAARGGAQLNG